VGQSSGGREGRKRKRVKEEWDVGPKIIDTEKFMRWNAKKTHRCCLAFMYVRYHHLFLKKVCYHRDNQWPAWKKNFFYLTKHLETKTIRVMCFLFEHRYISPRCFVTLFFSRHRWKDTQWIVGLV
jgi:hypothetical protein